MKQRDIQRSLSNALVRQRSRSREGAATVETALALAVFIVLVLGMVDLGYGLFRYHVLTQSVRQITRQAVVRGALSNRLAPWGPEIVEVKASDSNEVTELIASSLVGWELSEVDIKLEWIDGGNDPRQGHRVAATLNAPYRPMMTFIFGNPTIQFSASSTMQINH